MSTFDDAMKWLTKDNKRKNRERSRRGEGARHHAGQPGPAKPTARPEHACTRWPPQVVIAAVAQKLPAGHNKTGGQPNKL